MCLARNCGKDVRWIIQEGSDEAQGAHYKQKEARSRKEGIQESSQGRVQA